MQYKALENYNAGFKMSLWHKIYLKALKRLSIYYFETEII